MLSMKVRLGAEYSSSDPTYNPNVARIGPGDRVIVDLQAVGLLTWPGLPASAPQEKVGSFEAGVWFPPDIFEVKAVHAHTQTDGWIFDPFSYDAATGIVIVKAKGAPDLKGLSGATLCSIEVTAKVGTTGRGGVISLFASKLGDKAVPAMSAEFRIERATWSVSFEDITVTLGGSERLGLVLAPEITGAKAPNQEHPYFDLTPVWDLNEKIAQVTGGAVGFTPPSGYTPLLRQNVYARSAVFSFRKNKTDGVYSPLGPLELPYGPLVVLTVKGIKKGKTPINLLNPGVSPIPGRIPVLFGDGMIEVI